MYNVGVNVEFQGPDLVVSGPLSMWGSGTPFWDLEGSEEHPGENGGCPSSCPFLLASQRSLRSSSFFLCRCGAPADMCAPQSVPKPVP